MAPTTRSQAKDKTSAPLKATPAKVTKIKQAVLRQIPRRVSKSTRSNVIEYTKALLNSLTDAAENLAPVPNATDLDGAVPKGPAQIAMTNHQKAPPQHPVPRLSNGLVSLEKTPDHLIEM